MKKYNIRSIFFFVLITLSVFSYTYLSCASVPTAPAIETTKNIEETKEKANIYFPDISLVKKLIQLGKMAVR